MASLCNSSYYVDSQVQYFSCITSYLKTQNYPLYVSINVDDLNFVWEGMQVQVRDGGGKDSYLNNIYLYWMMV